MRRFSYTGGSTIGYTPAPEPDPITVQSVWTGTPTSEGFRINVRSTDATSVTVRYSTDPTLAGYSSAALIEAADDIWTDQLVGMDPDTLYYFDVLGDTGATIGRAWTSPEAGDPASFALWAAGDAGHSGMDYPSGNANISDAPTFDYLRALLEDGTVKGGWFLGDRHYRDSNTTSISTRRTIWHEVMEASKQYALHWQGWMMHTYDDHDYCGNDSNGTAAGRAIALQAFGENVPWPFDDISDGVYYTTVRGRVRFIDLDVRSRRSPNGNTDNGSKTRLGTVQKAWLFATLLAATEPLIVINVGSWIGGTSSFPDGWDSFSTERTEIFDFFVDEGLMDRILLVGSDLHCLVYDSGAHTNFATGAATDGPVYFGCAPIDAGIITAGCDADTVLTTRRQMFATLRFDDDGTDITVTQKGYALAAVPGGSYSEVLSETAGPFS